MQDWIVIALLANVLFAGSAVFEKIARTRHFRDSGSLALLMVLAQSLFVILLPFLSLEGDEIGERPYDPH